MNPTLETEQVHDLYTIAFVGFLFKLVYVLGILVGMPHSFYQKVVKEEIGLDLGAPNTYGSGIIFSPHSEESVQFVRELFASQASLQGFEVIGWRTLKTGKKLLFMYILVASHDYIITFIERNFTCDCWILCITR